MNETTIETTKKTTKKTTKSDNGKKTDSAAKTALGAAKERPKRNVCLTNMFSSDCDEEEAKKKKGKTDTEETLSKNKKRRQRPGASKTTAKKQKTGKADMSPENLALIEEIKSLKNVVQSFQQRAEDKKAAAIATKAKRAAKKKVREAKKSAKGLPAVTHVNHLIGNPTHNCFKCSSSAKDIHEWMMEEHKKKPLGEELMEKIDKLSKSEDGKKASNWRALAENLFEELCPGLMQRMNVAPSFPGDCMQQKTAIVDWGVSESATHIAAVVFFKVTRRPKVSHFARHAVSCA